MAKVSTTSTRYFISRKKRFAAEKRMHSPAVKSTRMKSKTGTHNSVTDSRTPAKGRSSTSTGIAIAISKREVSTDDKGKTSRGNLILVTRLLFPVRLVVPNRRADTKNAQGN